MSGDVLSAPQSALLAVDWASLWNAIGPLVGVILGGLLTYITTAVLQARQLRNENKVRFHERRIEACLDFLDLVTEIAFKKSRGEDTDPVQMLALSRAENAIRMLMRPKVVAAMNRLSNILQFRLAFRGEGSEDKRAFGEAMAGGFRAFTHAARSDLGVEIHAPELPGGPPDAHSSREGG